MPEDRELVGTPAHLPFMWPRRLLRPIARQATPPTIFGPSGHPIIEGYDPPEGWGWCYVDETFIELDHPTQQLGPIPRFAP